MGGILNSFLFLEFPTKENSPFRWAADRSSFEYTGFGNPSIFNGTIDQTTIGFYPAGNPIGNQFFYIKAL